MAEQLKACIDRPIILGNVVPSFAALLEAVKWENGRRLRVAFLDGEASVQQKVEQLAHRWSDYAHLKFAFGTDANAEIRISFLGKGSWSYLGRVALQVPAGQPTMNYGWLTLATPEVEVRRVVLHEFGHALGLIHEHQNPAGGIPWDKEAVYNYYMGPPNNWTKEDVDNNLFATYDQHITLHTAFDPKSVMLYPIPNELTIGDFEVGWNTDLSATDQEFIKRVYPRT